MTSETLPFSPAARAFQTGALLVAGSAILWSFGGSIARFIEAENSWTIVFWRSYFAALFLLIYMVLRDGPDGMLRLFRAMGLPGVMVASCFAIASTSFVVALSYTTVANILLMQAGVPLVASLLAFIFFRERVSLATGIAIAAVILGVGIMVSESLTGKVSPIGDGLALVITVVFSIAVVITRRHRALRMTPAVCLGTAIACLFSATIAGATDGYAVTLPDFFWLFLFGAVNLGLGLALFTAGARLVTAAVTSLIGLLEPVLAPLWVWLIHAEVPSRMTLIGGGVVFAALFVHVLIELRRAKA